MARRPVYFALPLPAEGRERTSAPRVRLVLLVALLIAATAFAHGGLPAAAQTVATSEPAIVVFGVGKATAPAVSATVQLVIGRGDRDFGFELDGQGGSSSWSGGGEEGIVIVEPDTVGTPEAAPEAEALGSIGTPEASRRDRRGMREERPRRGPLTADELTPIVETVAAVAGIDRDGIDLDLSPLAPDPYAPSAQSARLDFDVTQTSPEALNALIVAASDAASDSGLVVDLAGVGYNPADCDALEQAAELAAIADARTRAERIAAALNVTLGGVVAASSDIFSGAYPGSACAEDTFYYDSGFGGLGLSVPVFDPGAEGEVFFGTNLTIAFAIVGDPSG